MLELLGEVCAEEYKLNGGVEGLEAAAAAAAAAAATTTATALSLRYSMNDVDSPDLEPTVLRDSTAVLPFETSVSRPPRE